MKSVVFPALLLGLGLASPAALAVVIGYHDVSDPVKTAGWVCETTSTAPVRVHLYALTTAGPRLIDSQLADKRRGDLPYVCPSATHAFRFADYAANGAGATLYNETGPVRLEAYAETPGGLIPINGTGRDVSFAPVGVWDPGLTNGRWRTDLPDQSEGTATTPLLLGECPFTTPVSDGYPAFSGGGFVANSGCRYHQIVFPRSNAASSEAVWPTHSFWTVVANVEDALDNPLCTDGPPGQSLPVGAPGAGEVFGVVALPDTESARPDRKKIHMVINSRNWTACRHGSYAGPYLAIAAQADRGNNGVITYLNRPGAATALKFGMTLMDIDGDPPEKYGALENARRYSQAHMLIEAMWGGIKRWIFIELVPDVRRVKGQDEGSVDAHIRFNWHLTSSMMYPGADYLYKSGSVVTAQCAAEGVKIPVFDRRATYVNPATRARSRIEYSIDLQRLFDCVNRRGDWGAAPMPAHPVPVMAVMFGMEQDDRYYLDSEFTGVVAPNAIWVAIDSVRVE